MMDSPDTKSVLPHGYVHAQQAQCDDAYSASSVTSQDSIFSDPLETSSQSSFADSDTESSGRLIAERHRKDTSQQLAPTTSYQPSLASLHSSQVDICPSQRQHPRRTSSSCNPPPSLPRQEERKVLFVNDLVDSATAIVEAIWPLSGSPCTQQNANGRGILPLRRYIEETLRRSRTSYSTLQVALYYLVLVRPHVPTHDTAVQQSADSAPLRAMQCGRRMFLAALILASKYLQDRNYSAKAWSKMSGLRTVEINSNERLFLSAVSWRLHIPEAVFKRWADIVLKYTAPHLPPPAGQSFGVADIKAIWKRVIPLLTPDLHEASILGRGSMAPRSTAIRTDRSSSATSTPFSSGFAVSPALQESTPTTSTTTLLQQPAPRSQPAPPTPALVRMGPLPTPQMTPSSEAASTPAASTCSPCRPSMPLTMAHAQARALCRSTSDRFPPRRTLSGRSSSGASVASSSLVSFGSSPESLVSDSSRSSRSSSISSVSGMSISAPCQTASVRLATCRLAGHEFGCDCASKSDDITAKDGAVSILNDADLTSSPTSMNVAIGNEVNTMKAPPFPRMTSCRKRGRARPGLSGDSELQSHVRSLLAKSHLTDQETEDLEGKISRSSVSPCVLQQAWKNNGRAASCTIPKGVQSPCALERGSCGRVPICSESGRKRVCSNVEPTLERS